MVNVVGNGILDEAVSISVQANAFEKGMNPTIQPTTMNEIGGQTGCCIPGEQMITTLVYKNTDFLFTTKCRNRCV